MKKNIIIAVLLALLIIAVPAGVLASTVFHTTNAANFNITAQFVASPGLTVYSNSQCTSAGMVMFGDITPFTWRSFFIPLLSDISRRNMQSRGSGLR